MGTVGAIVVLLILLISAAVTLVIILVTVPSDDDELSRTTWDYTDTSDTTERQTHQQPQHQGQQHQQQQQQQRDRQGAIGDRPLIFKPLTVTESSQSTPSEPTADRSGNRSLQNPFISSAPKDAIVRKIPVRLNATGKLRSGVSHMRETLHTNLRMYERPTTFQPFQFNDDHLFETQKPPLSSTTDNDFEDESTEQSDRYIPAIKLNLLRELPLQKSSKITGMIIHNGLLYIAYLQGRIQVIDPVTGEQVSDSFDLCSSELSY